MKKVIFLFLLFSGLIYGQEFENIGFEDTFCINDCDPANGQMSCVDGWWSDYTQGVVPLKNTNCEPNLVCNGNNSVLLVSTSGAPGSSIRTNNPFFGLTTDTSFTIDLTVNRSSNGTSDGVVKVIGRYAGQYNWDVVGQAGPSASDICEDITIILDPSVTDYEELSFVACTETGTCHGGLGNYIVVDDIRVGKPAVLIEDNCGIVTLSINPNLNLDIAFFDVIITNDAGDEIAEIFNETGDPLSYDIGATGTYHFEILIAYEINGQFEFLEYNLSHTITSVTPLPVTITANGTDITSSLEHIIPCGESCVTINATNITNAIYNTSDPVLTDLNGLFCMPPGSSITSFTANITGLDSCGNPYNESVLVTLEQDCCVDEPYVEPHWELCETNNVCELDSWPIRVLDDDGSPLLLIDGYTFSWSLNGTEISTSDILYGAQEDLTYTVTVTYPDGCEYTITYLEICCVPEAISITANGTDITDTLTYTIPCGENCVTINATNITDGVYNTSDPVLTDLNGLFCVPPGSDITSFTANITGLDSCGDPYNQNVTVFIEQDCCLDDISVIFDECPDEELMANTAQYRASANTIVTPQDAMSAYGIISNNPKGIKDCDPCESGVVSATVVDGNGDPITNFVSINVSWAANPIGVNVNTNQFLVYVDVLYTVTVTVIDPEGHECVYTYDFIYECETKECDGLTAPTNLQNNGSSLSWDPVPGAVSYIISSPSVIRIECCRVGVSIAPITTSSASYALPLSLQSKCFVWQVAAICADGTQSPVSEQSCHLPTLRLQENAGVKEQIMIYPNPSKGHVDIKVEFDGGSVVELDIYRYDGLLVKTIKRQKLDNKTLKFDLELDLPTGLYLFNFKTKNGMISKRVIIE